jgi:hypothetical protein
LSLVGLFKVRMATLPSRSSMIGGVSLMVLLPRRGQPIG